jgi:hypothetical protein
MCKSSAHFVVKRNGFKRLNHHQNNARGCPTRLLQRIAKSARPLKSDVGRTGLRPGKIGGKYNGQRLKIEAC